MIADANRQVAIDTPEGIRFTLPLAGPGARFTAWVIDLAITLAAITTLSRTFAVFQGIDADIVRAILTASYFAISVGYGIAFEWWWRGQTIGKRVLGLRVVDAQGMQLEWSQILIRNLLRVVDLLPALYLVGGAAMLWTRNAQRLGDMAANTLVVRKREAIAIDPARINVGRYNSLRENRPLAARLRQKMRPNLAAIAYEAVLRRDEIDPLARVDLFRELAKELRQVVPFPNELTEGMTDEQYVRAALDAVM